MKIDNILSFITQIISNTRLAVAAFLAGFFALILLMIFPELVTLLTTELIFFVVFVWTLSLIILIGQALAAIWNILIIGAKKIRGIPPLSSQEKDILQIFIDNQKINSIDIERDHQWIADKYQLSKYDLHERIIKLCKKGYLRNILYHPDYYLLDDKGKTYCAKQHVDN
jgi:hypothetical protein